MDLLTAIVVAIWVMLPAYLPNNIAVLAGGGAPIDGGRSWRGRRILGDGKTWRGTLFGIIAGSVAALVLNFGNSAVGETIGIELPVFTAGIVIAFPIGALLGDIFASFLKRRTGRERGSAFPLVDQLDFVVVALLAGMVLDPHWMLDTFTPLLLGIILIITPLLHVVTNIIAYRLGLKNEPW